MPMPKHGSTIDAITVPLKDIKNSQNPRNPPILPKGKWAEFAFIDAAIGEKSKPFENAVSAIVNNSFYVDHSVVTFLTAKSSLNDSGTIYTFFGWYSLHDILNGGDPIPPGVTSPVGLAPGDPELKVNKGYFRAVAVYTY
jgi:hypothetical protein